MTMFNPHEQDTATQLFMAAQQGKQIDFGSPLLSNRIVVYDAETRKAVPQDWGGNDPKYQYCSGWHDYLGMGISVICAYDYAEDRYRTFLRDNLGDFQALLDRSDIVVGFYNHKFDDNLIAAHGIKIAPGTSYDLSAEIKNVAAKAPKSKDGSWVSMGLDAFCWENFRLRKTDHGDNAAFAWQRGEYGHVIDYCLEDVRLTKKLFDAAMVGPIKNPDPRRGEYLELRSPYVGGN